MWLRVVVGNMRWQGVGLQGEAVTTAMQIKEISVPQSENVANSDSLRASRK